MKNRPPAAEPLSGETVHLWVRPAEFFPGRALPEVASKHNARSQADLLAVLSQYRHPLPEMLREEGGKPYFREGPHFNLSHSGGGTAVAVSLRPVGVDIESPARRADYAGISRKFFFRSEAEAVEKAPEHLRAKVFLDLWTAKEAMTKLAGAGIYKSLREANVGGSEGFLGGRPARIARFGDGLGLVGAVATWEIADVKIFEIAAISGRETGCHSKT